MDEVNIFLFGKFNYDEISRARAGNREVEVKMLGELVNADAVGHWTLKELADALHEMVHVANHYVVVEGPAPGTVAG